MSLALISEAYFLDSDSDTGDGDDDRGKGSEFAPCSNDLDSESGSENSSSSGATEIIMVDADTNRLSFRGHGIPPEVGDPVRDTPRRKRKRRVGNWMWSYRKRQQSNGKVQRIKARNQIPQKVYSNRDRELTNYISESSSPNGVHVSPSPANMTTYPNSTSQKSTSRRPSKRAHKCTKCGVSFAERRHLCQHMKLHSDFGRPWKCSRCGCTFTAKNSLRQHVLRHGWKTPSKNNLGRANEPYPVCGKGFRTSRLPKHLRTVHGLSKSNALLELKGGPNLEQEAPKSPTLLNALSRLRTCKLVLTRCDHLASKYARFPEGERPDGDTLLYTCPYCFQSFLEPNLLIAHLPIHDLMDQQQNKIPEPTAPVPTVQSTSSYKCEQCNYSCASTQTLRRHMKFHSEEGREFRCKKCGYNFTTSESLRSHHGRYHKATKQLHKCQSCTYSCKSLGTLMFHMEVHKEEGRPFKCSPCRYTFKSLQGLRVHESWAHPGIKSSIVPVVLQRKK